MSYLPVEELARTVDWDEHFYSEIVDQLLRFPNHLPIKVCEEDGELELIDGKHRLGAAVRSGRHAILAWHHIHELDPRVRNTQTL